MKEQINKSKMDEEMSNAEFSMSSEEMEEAKQSSFNSFFSTTEMKENYAYKFKAVADKINVRDIVDKFAERNKDGTFNKTPRLILTAEELESGVVYDIAAPKNANKEGKYPSLTSAVRKFYALCNGNILGKHFTLTKRMYRHDVFGDTAGYIINLVEAGETQIH